MAKHASKAEYWEAKYHGQQARCLDLKATIEGLETDLLNHKSVIRANGSRIGSYIHTIKLMKAKIIRMEEVNNGS